jgi:hypothetical protein
MKKDIPVQKVEDLAVAVVPRQEEDELWDVFILNMRTAPIQNVLVNSRGYGELNGESMKTTVLRHFFEEIKAESTVLLEPIQVKLFELTNEYWVSFTYDEYMFDKKYVFVKGSIRQDNFTLIPYLNKKGVMIR